VGKKQFLTIIGLLVLAGAAFFWQSQWRFEEANPVDGVVSSTESTAGSTNSNNAVDAKSPFAVSAVNTDASSSPETNVDSQVADA